MPRAGVLEGASAPPILHPKPTRCQTGAAHLTPSPRNQVARHQVPKLGTAPSHGFHQGFTRATREVASPRGSSIRFAGRAATETQPATPPLTSGGELAAGHGFVLPPRPPPGAVSTSRDDSKPRETRAPSLLILNLLVCKAAAVAQRLAGRVALQGETEAQRGTAPRSDPNAATPRSARSAGNQRVTHGTRQQEGTGSKRHPRAGARTSPMTQLSPIGSGCTSVPLRVPRG